VKPAVAAHAASAKPKAACKGYLIHGRCSATCANGDGDCPDPKERCEMWSGTDDTGLSAMNAPLCIYSASNEPRAKGAPSASSGAWTPPQSIVMPKYTESIRAPDGRVIPTDGKCTSGYGGPIAPYNRCHYLCSGDSDCEKGLRCKPFKNMKACQEP
jgi:hypothetical protein